MKSPLAAALLLTLALAPCSCIQQQQQQQRKPAEEAEPQRKRPLPPMHLGAVHQVYPEQGFALLRIIGPMPTEGTTLITHPADGTNSRIGNLCISSQQASRNGIIAADIRSGLVVKGDRVFRYRNIAAGEDEGGDVIAVDPPVGVVDDANDPVPDIPIPEPSAEEEEEAAPAPGADIPEPFADESGTAIETTVLPDSGSSAPDSPSEAPSYLDDIPDDVNAWN